MYICAASRGYSRAAVAGMALLTALAAVAELTQTVERVKSAVVGIGTYQAARKPQVQFRGTGFVVADGLHVVTNGHVLTRQVDVSNKETLVVLVGRGPSGRMREAQTLASDPDHDLALLRLTGDRLPALAIGDSRKVKEGQDLAFTGFPIGAVLGLYPVTHRATISSITPIVIPQLASKRLDPRVVNRLRNPFEVFQLDATAYPGNSGSPLFDPDTGLVLGVVNMVFVKGTKESAIEDPSGISYAIPSEHIGELLQKAGLQR